MMETIEIQGKKFRKLIDNQIIEIAIWQSKEVIDNLILNTSDIVFIVMANGANWFAQKIFSFYENYSLHIEYARLESYSGTQQTEIQFISMPKKADLYGKTIIVLEDILDSGKTMEHLKKWLHEQNVREIHLIALCKREGNGTKTDNTPLVVAQGEWIVGCGMDYNHCGRNFSHIYTMTK